jgi:hypothetical protein
MTTLKALAKKLGAQLTHGSEGCRYLRYYADAPKGKCWTASPDLHCLVMDLEELDPAGNRDAKQDLYERMQMGLEDCANPRCDVCHPEPDYRNTAPHASCPRCGRKLRITDGKFPEHWLVSKIGCHGLCQKSGGMCNEIIEYVPESANYVDRLMSDDGPNY